jgi:hypothetical protein
MIEDRALFHDALLGIQPCNTAHRAPSPLEGEGWGGVYC